MKNIKIKLGCAAESAAEQQIDEGKPATWRKGINFFEIKKMKIP